VSTHSGGVWPPLLLPSCPPHLTASPRRRFGRASAALEAVEHWRRVSSLGESSETTLDANSKALVRAHPRTSRQCFGLAPLNLARPLLFCAADPCGPSLSLLSLSLSLSLSLRGVWAGTRRRRWR
jgi:hypothetical protein